MVFKCRIAAEQKALAILLRKQCSASLREIAKKCRISKSSAERICKDKRPERKNNHGLRAGRPRKVNDRSLRVLLRCFEKLRRSNVNITVKALVEESGLGVKMASRRTFSRWLNKNGYGFFQARKKGLLSETDRKKRVAYARHMKRCLLPQNTFWTEEVSFYLDGVSFIYKHNPFSSATSPKSLIWRKRGVILHSGPLSCLNACPSCFFYSFKNFVSVAILTQLVCTGVYRSTWAEVVVCFI